LGLVHGVVAAAIVTERLGQTDVEQDARHGSEQGDQSFFDRHSMSPSTSPLKMSTMHTTVPRPASRRAGSSVSSPFASPTRAGGRFIWLFPIGGAGRYHVGGFTSSPAEEDRCAASPS
jgi:hypothetical protein